DGVSAREVRHPRLHGDVFLSVRAGRGAGGARHCPVARAAPPLHEVGIGEGRAAHRSEQSNLARMARHTRASLRRRATSSTLKTRCASRAMRARGIDRSAAMPRAISGVLLPTIMSTYSSR